MLVTMRLCSRLPPLMAITFRKKESPALSEADGVIYVTGTPADFAGPVCQIMFNQWGLRFRRDLVDLIPKVAIQLSRMDDERFWIETTRPQNEPQAERTPDNQEESPPEILDG